MNTALTIVVAVLGSTALSQLIQFFIKRNDDKKDIPGKLQILEKDVLRTQLLMMIILRPDSKKEILTLAKHYFADLHGNWYLTDVFNHWLKEQGDSEPSWFRNE